MTRAVLRAERGGMVAGGSVQPRHHGKAPEGRACNSGKAQVVVLRQPDERDDPPDEEALKDRCLHTAETWVLKRRASRPHLGRRHLPVVARVG